MEAPPLERKLVAIFAADVEGYSRIMERDEVAALGTLSAHRAITDEVIALKGGRIANTAGDSIIAEFGSVFDAVQAAADIQERIAEANQDLPEQQQMHFRIGINVGDVMVKDGDIFGDGVNIAARLQSLARPGGICLSRGVRDQVRRKLPYGYRDLGEQSVKNIAQPIRVFELCLGVSQMDEAAAELESGRSLSDESSLAEPSAILDPPPGEAELVPPDPQVELAFWASAEQSGRAADLEAYLESYPEGAFAALARTRLTEPAEAEPSEAQAAQRIVELAFWETIKDSDNPAMFEAYIEKYPDGEFKAIAAIRLEELK